MKQLFFKQYKSKIFQKIAKTSNLIYIFRYNDLKIDELLLLKKQIKRLNYNLIFLKKKLIITNTFTLKGQGSILMIYSTNKKISNPIFPIINISKKLNLISLNINQHTVSPLKLKTIFSTTQTFNIILLQQFLAFLFYLKALKMANIT